MPRYVALLRGVSPQNASMPALKACFESAGFARSAPCCPAGTWFDADRQSDRALETLAEACMMQALGRNFYTIVRSADELRQLLAADLYAEHGIPPEAKRVVSFFREPVVPRVSLPLAQDMASVFLVRGREAYTAYLPGDKGPVFMNLIERAFGKDVTTRTLDTVAKCAAA
ncbi:MAG: DUF1697 domain-containing protein [Burkholderiaceae bacterium]